MDKGSEGWSTYRIVVVTLLLLSTALLHYQTSPRSEDEVEGQRLEQTLMASMKRSLQQQADYVATKAENLEVIVQALTRILIKYQSTQEQRVRVESISGIAETRTYHSGPQPYHLLNTPVLNMVRPPRLLSSINYLSL